MNNLNEQPVKQEKVNEDSLDFTPEGVLNNKIKAGERALKLLDTLPVDDKERRAEVLTQLQGFREELSKLTQDSQKIEQDQSEISNNIADFVGQGNEGVTLDKIDRKRSFVNE